MRPETNEEFLTVREVAEKLHISVPRVYQLIAEGFIPGVYRTGKRTLRINRSEFMEWREGRRHPGR